MRKTITIAGGALSTLQGALHDPDVSAAIQQWTSVAQQDARYTVTMTAPLNLDIDNLYAGHRSHSSHSSHSSHYSGSGGSYRSTTPSPTASPTPIYPSTYTSPTPVPSSTPPPSSYPQSNSLAPSRTVRPTADQLSTIIMRVQAALFARGYDPGAIDGQLSRQTRAALTSFQAEAGIQQTGMMTTDTLNALGVRLVP